MAQWRWQMVGSKRASIRATHYIFLASIFGIRHQLSEDWRSSRPNALIMRMLVETLLRAIVRAGRRPAPVEIIT
ncbi:hypothetical protein KCP75_00925 [Salmonella enterica subsp. enterica]|nr:hypothetical protein KCP75_00925 [Salmonella enterica subsp. enterica]